MASPSPKRQGLYDPRHERDSCGVNFVCDMSGEVSHEIVSMAIGALCNLEHRGAQGADVNTRDNGGRTALIRAVQRGAERNVALLLAHDADASVRDNKGRTALRFTEQEGREKIAVLLRTAGARD